MLQNNVKQLNLKTRTLQPLPRFKPFTQEIAEKY